MPIEDHNCLLEKYNFDEKKEKKCKKNPIQCFKEEPELDCCSPAYIRLDKLRTGWSAIPPLFFVTPTYINTSSGPIINGITTRAGQSIFVPNAALFQGTGSQTGYGISIADVSTSSSGSVRIILDFAYYAYVFVNTIRYISFESCNKSDQVTGWLVDTTTGNLEIFQDLPELNLTTNDNRAYLISLSCGDISTIQKSKLQALDILYKLSLKAICEVNGNPKQEGNIILVSDKCGKKWLIAINRVVSSTNVCIPTSQFVIVASPAW